MNHQIDSFSQILSKQQQNSSHVTEQSLLRSFPHPVHIISPDFKSRHLAKLVQQLEKFQIPIQFQHQTQTLGYDLSKNHNNFFVVVDNKKGKINLGEEFNSEVMTIVGYPKIGRNQNNIYCQDPAEVVQSYKQFIAFKSGKVSKFCSDGDSNLSINKNRQNVFKPLQSQNSHIKLKCVSKLNINKKQNKNFDEEYNMKNNANGLNQSSVQKKQIPSILLVFNPNLTIQDHLLQTSITEQNQYSKMLNKIKDIFGESQSSQKRYFELKGFADLVNKVINLKSKQIVKTSYFILAESKQVDLLLKTNLNGHFLNQTKLIVCFFAHNHDNNNPSYQIEDQNKKIQITKKCNKLKNFYSLLFTEEQCIKTLKSCGFSMTKSKKHASNKKIQSKSKIKCLSVSKRNLQSNTKLKESNNNIPLVQQKIKQKSTKQLNFCLQKQNNSDQLQKMQEIQIQKEQKQDILLPLKSQFQSKSKSKILIIRPIKSLLQQKSSLSSSLSKKKIKIIKFDKSPSKIKQDKHISQVNSQYCSNVINKILSKKQLSSKSISSQKYLKIKQNTVKKVKIQEQYQKKQSSPIISSQKTTYRKLKLFGNNKPQSFVVTQSCQSFDNLQSNNPYLEKKSGNKQTDPSTPVFKDANQYYFGTQYSFKGLINNQGCHAIDGMLYIEHNDIICQLIKRFKQNCPISLIPRKQYRPFYFAREYSHQLNKMWKQKKSRECVSILIDLQGLQQIVKYYSNVFYEDDELQYYSKIQQNTQKQKGFSPQQKFTNTQQASNSLKILCFVLIQNQKQQQNQLFEQMKAMMYKLPIFKITKLVNKKHFNVNLPQQQNKKNISSLYQNIYSRIMSESLIQKEKGGFSLAQTN